MTIRTDMIASRAPMASFCTLGILWGSFAAAVPDLKAVLGVDDGAFGLLFLCSATAAVLAMGFAARIGQRLGAASLPAATLLMAAAFSLPGQATQIPLFAVAMVLMGGSSGLLDVLMNARISAIENARGMHLMNLNHAAFSFAYALSALCTGLARGAGAGPSLVLGVASLCAALLALATIERGARLGSLRAPSEAVQQRLGWGPVWAGVIILIGFLAENAVEAWSALHIERTLGGSPAAGGFGPTLLGLTMGIGRLWGQVVVRRISEAGLLRASVLVSAVGAVGTGLAGSPPVAYVALIVLGFGLSVIVPTAYAVVGRKAGNSQDVARAIARATMLGYLGFFFGPPLLGLLSDLFGLGMSFLAVAALLLALLPVIPAMMRWR